MEQVYTLPEIKQTVKVLERIFDLVRLVEPYEMLECDLEKCVGSFVFQPHKCFAIWGKDGRCDNCVSEKALAQNRRKTKYEFSDRDIYCAVATPVNVDGKRFSLEIVCRVDDDVILGASGQNEFLDIITSYNAKCYRDILTGVYNRRFLSERMLVNDGNERFADRAVAVMDVDNFTGMNELYSQSFGDELLVRLARYLETLIDAENGDCVLRVSGDEFMVVFNSISSEQFAEKLDNLMSAAHNARFKASDEICVSLSIGTATAAEHPEYELEKLISVADERLFAAKANGGNMIVMN